MSSTTTPTSTDSPILAVTKADNSSGKITNSSTTALSYTFGSVCLLCLRTKTCTSVKSDPEKHRQGQLICMKYVVLVSRYLNLDTELTKLSQKNYFNVSSELKDVNQGDNDSELDIKEEISKFIICDSCLPIAEAFCKTYHEYELIRMKLEAKLLESTELFVKKSEVLGENLKTLRGAKRGGTKGPESDSNLEMDALAGFRNELKTHASKFVKITGPRLKLKRDKKAEELIQKKIPKIHTSSHNPVLKTSTKSTDKVSIRTGGTCAPRLNPKVKIVRRAAGGSSKAPEISIIRLPSEPSSPESENNNNDIEILDVLPKISNGITKSALPTSVVGPESYTSPVPNQQQKQNNILFPVVTTVLLDPNIFQSITSSPSLHCQEGMVQNFVTSSSQMLPLPVPVDVQKCNINGCGVVFPKTEQGLIDMQNHTTTHGELPCTKCPAILKSPFELISHELKHDETRPSTNVKQGFQCTRCPHYSMLRTEHQEHFLERHLNTKIELLKCLVCKKGFSHLKLQQLQSHLTNCHPNEETDDLSSCHSCMICRVYFRKRVNLWKHLKNDHRISTQGGCHKCPDCPATFLFENLMLLHKEFSCENRQQHNCPYPGCTATFPRIALVNRHLESAHNDVNEFQFHECPICKLKFNELSILKQHVQTHNGEQVKLVFTDDQEPHVLPVEVEASNNISNNIFTTSSVLTQLPSALDHNVLGGGYNFTTNIPVSSGVAQPLSTSSQTQVIGSVTGTPQMTDYGSNYIPPNNQNFTQANHTQPTEPIAVPADVDLKVFYEMFDESNDSEEPTMMDIFGNAIPVEAGGGEENPQTDEDPFAWMLTEDFDIN